MKIAIDGREADGLAGKARYIREIIKGIIENNLADMEFVIFAKDRLPFEFDENVKFRFLPRTIYPFSTNIWLRNVLRKEKFALFFAPTGYLPAVFSPVKTIIMVPDLAVYRRDTRPARKTEWAEKILLPLAVKKAAIIITISRSTKNDLIERFGRKIENKIRVTYLAAADKFKPLAPEKTMSIIKKCGLEYKKYLLTVGTIEPRKNYLNLIKAYLFLPQKIQDEFSLVIVGHCGWNYTAIMRAAGKNDNIKILTGVGDDDLPFLYNGAKLFCYPSLYEGFGLPVLEAMSCGCPVVTSNTSSLPEVGGETAAYVNPYQPQSIAVAMEKLINDNQLCFNLTKKGQIQAKKFSWRKTIKETISIFSELKK